MESIFQEDEVVLLKKTTEEGKSIFTSFGIPKGTAVAVNNSGEIQQIKKSSIVYPKYTGNDLIIMEIDKVMTMEGGYEILMMLQKKIKELADIQVDNLIAKTYEEITVVRNPPDI